MRRGSNPGSGRITARAGVFLCLLGLFPLVARAEFRVFEGPYVDGPIYAMAEYAGSLVVAGHFDQMGTEALSNVAVWDGSTWRGIGPIVDEDEFIYALCVVDGDLLAGVTQAVRVEGADLDLLEIHTVQRWDGRSWTQLGAPLPESPRALAVHGGELFAGLRFAMPARGESPMYRWDGSDWQPCDAPAGEQIIQVRALASYRRRLFVGGSFLSDLEPGSLPTAVYAYDGQSWVVPGDGLRSDQFPLTVNLPEGIQGAHDLLVVGDELYATGNFVQSTTAIAGLAKWDGSAWIGLPTVGTGHGLVEFQSRLVPYGILAHDTGSGAYDIFLGALQGSRWVPLEPTGPDRGRCDPVALSAVEFDGELVLARDFSYQYAGFLYATPSPSLTAWDGTRWRSLVPGESPTENVVAMLEYEGRLVCGGAFQYVGGQPAHCMAAWDGAEWTAMGVGFDPTSWFESYPGEVDALATVGNTLFAGGRFSSANDSDLTDVARWDGDHWAALGGGIDDGTVYALADFQGQLVAGGTFSRAGTVSVTGLATWDGSTWIPQPPGIEFDVPTLWYRGRVAALVEYQGQLYAGGDFETIGGAYAPYLARWNGSQWEGLGQSPAEPQPVWALEVHQGRLMIAAGTHVLAWDGEQILLLGSTDGSPRAVNDLMSDGDHLYVTGAFNAIDGVPADGVAVWDGASWSSPGRPGQPANGPGTSLGRLRDDIYVGGAFKRPQDPNRWHLFSFPAATSVPAVSIQLEARASGSGVQLSWQLRHGELADELQLERRSGPSAAWRALFTRSSGENTSGEISAQGSYADASVTAGETYAYRLVATVGGSEQISNEVSIDVPDAPARSRSCIVSATPNPFNPQVTINVLVATLGDVYVDVFDAAGRHVKQLERSTLNAGSYGVTWRGLDRAGRPVASGIYTVLLRTPDARDARQITLVK